MNRINFHDYQYRAVDFIYQNRRCAMFLDMGLGKTAIALTAISDLMDSFVIHRALVIAPLRVANSVWKQEAEKWDHLRHLKISVCTGPEPVRKEGFNRKADVYVINRENVQWLVEHCGRKWPFDAIIIDESSSFKNSAAKRFRKLKKPSQIAKVMILLTGTPSPNGLLDLWSQIYLMDGGASLGRTITGYKKQYFTPDYFGYTWTPKHGAHETIQNLLRPKVLSMTASDYLELPERIELEERCYLSDTVMEAYQNFERELLIDLATGEQLEASTVAVLANKLLQLANGAVYTDDSGAWAPVHDEKLNVLEEIIEENPNENILVAYNYKTDLTRLQKKFPNSVALDKDPKTIERWNRGEVKLLLAHPASCGHGLNLQNGGSMVVWFGLNWSLELDQQMNARLYRQGQTKPVRVVRIVAKDTIDERVLSVLKEKDRTQSQLINALKEGWKCKCCLPN